MKCNVMDHTWITEDALKHILWYLLEVLESELEGSTLNFAMSNIFGKTN